MGFRCFKCLKIIEGDLKLFFFHLKHSHLIHERSHTNIICAQNDCNSVFLRLSNYKRHIINNHKNVFPARQNPNFENVHDHRVDIDAVPSDHEAMEESEEEEGHSHETISDLKDTAAVFVAKLKAYTALPNAVINEVIIDVGEIMSHTTSYIERKLDNIAKQMPPQYLEDFPEVSDLQRQLLSDLHDLANPFIDLLSEYKRTDYFLKKGALILPEEKLLGHTLTSKVDKSTGNAIQIQQEDTFQYISLHQTLKKNLEQPGIMTAIQNFPGPNDDGSMCSFKDGSYHKEAWNDNTKHPLVPLLIYSDDFETANPLGSRKGVHKQFSVYCSVLSLPREYQARLEHIHLVALGNSKFVSKYGLDTFFEFIVADLNKMYSNGIYLDCDDYKGYVYPKLFQIIGDNLALNPLLGFSGSFSANYFCRFCKMFKTVSHVALEEDSSLLRNKENIQEDVITSNPPVTGVWRSSILNQLSYYHVSENFAVDIMHDIFEGVAPKEIKLVLGALIDRGCFTLEELNRRILCFSYGFKDKDNRPSIIPATSIRNPSGPSGQKAVQMICLVQFLPLIIGDKVAVGCDYWEVLLALFEIIKIATAPAISYEGTIYLQTLIKEHHRLYLMKFEDQHLIPKQHFMLHYHRIIQVLGPLNQYSCMRFEGKHKPLKNYARLCNNYQNIAKTLAQKHQTNQSYKYLLRKPLNEHQFDLFNQSVVKLSSLEAARTISQELNILMDADVTIASRVEVFGSEFRLGSMLKLSPDNAEDDPIFSQIISMVVHMNEVYFIGSDWETMFYERHYQAFAVKPRTPPQFHLYRTDNLLEIRPLHAAQSHDAEGNTFFIACRHRCL